MPPLDVPDGERPAVSAAEYEARIAALLDGADVECLVVYGDREHAANLAHLCNFDPRFEEALLVLAGQQRTLIVGKEGAVYAPVVPIHLDVVCCPTFSLMGIDRSGFPVLDDALRDAGVAPGTRIGVVGWKALNAAESRIAAPSIFAPAFIVDTLRHLAGSDDLVVDVTAVLTDAARGHRAVCSADQIALFEWGASRCGAWAMSVIDAARPGARERAAFEAVRWGGEPLSFHPVFAAGPDVAVGLRSASARRFQLGDAAIVGIGLWGGNCARGGIVAAALDDLRAESDGYLERLVVPYWRAMVAWYQALGVGVRGGDIFATVTDALAGEGFAPSLNPGHLIHYEEWLNSPIRAGSDDAIASGMVMQSDIIPTGIRAGWITNCEDTVALADDALRGEIAARHPALWARVQARRVFVQERLGVTLPVDVLPLTPTVLYLPPLWMSPHLALART